MLLAVRPYSFHCVYIRLYFVRGNYAGDPLGELDVTPLGFARLTERLQSLAGGKLVLVLEGGYNLAAIAKSCAACAKELVGDKNMLKRVRRHRNDDHPAPDRVYLKATSRVINVHKKYWKSLQS